MFVHHILEITIDGSHGHGGCSQQASLPAGGFLDLVPSSRRSDKAFWAISDIENLLLDSTALAGAMSPGVSHKAVFPQFAPHPEFSQISGVCGRTVFAN